MVKVRLQGLPDEVKEAAERLKERFNILEESSDYQNRNSQYIRVYMDVDFDKGKGK